MTNPMTGDKSYHGLALLMICQAMMSGRIRLRRTEISSFRPSFLFFQPLKLQLVKRLVISKAFDHIVQVAMFTFKFVQF